MSEPSAKTVLENGLDLKELVTTGSLLQINMDYYDENTETETEPMHQKPYSVIGEPVTSFAELAKQMVPVDKDGYVRKKIIIKGGGVELNDDNTVSITYTGYWEGDVQPFDTHSSYKPLDVDLSDNGLLPGLLIAVKSMLVGELSVFLLSYKLMFGELGIPPRIKPKADCVFYVQLIRSIITPNDRHLDFSERNVFHRVKIDVLKLYESGVVRHKYKNYSEATSQFRKAVNILHGCRLADEKEEKLQEKLLIKIYTNLAISYNKMKLPLKACIACNEINRLSNIWNNPKVLFQNAKALRMIGDYSNAEKKLRRAMKLNPDNDELTAELQLLIKTKECCNQSKLIVESPVNNIICEEFKTNVHNLITKFKENDDLCKLSLPGKLTPVEIDYIKKACEKENIFCNKIETNFALDKGNEDLPIDDTLDDTEFY